MRCSAPASPYCTRATAPVRRGAARPASQRAAITAPTASRKIRLFRVVRFMAVLLSGGLWRPGAGGARQGAWRGLFLKPEGGPLAVRPRLGPGEGGGRGGQPGARVGDGGAVMGQPEPARPGGGGQRPGLAAGGVAVLSGLGGVGVVGV